MNQKTKSIIQYLIFLALGILILYLSYVNFSAAYIEDCMEKGIPTADCSLLHKLFEDFKGANFLWILLITVLYLISNIFRALRWKQLLAPLGYDPSLVNTIGATMIGYLANLGLPRLGEIIKPGILTKYDKVPIQTGLGTIVLDRILDIISLGFFVVLAFIVSFGMFRTYFEENFSIERSTSLIYLGVVLGIGLVIFYFINRMIRSKNSSNLLISRIQYLWIGFTDGLMSIKKVKNIPLLIFYSLMIWLMYYLMTYLCFFAYTPTEHLGWQAGLVVFIFGTLGIVFPSPGGMGSYHFLVTQALIINGLNSADAFSFSNIVFFSIQIFGNILFGVLFLIVLPILNKK